MYQAPAGLQFQTAHATKEGFTITVIDDQLITAGGYRSKDDVKDTNKLFSLTGEGSGRRWTEKFPPMPTKRWGVSTLCTGTVLIVAEGYVGHQLLKTVEVLNTETGRDSGTLLLIYLNHWHDQH